MKLRRNILELVPRSKRQGIQLFELIDSPTLKEYGTKEVIVHYKTGERYRLLFNYIGDPSKYVQRGNDALAHAGPEKAISESIIKRFEW